MSVTLSNRVISAVQRIITGDPAERSAPLSPYRSGPALVDFFNELGFDYVYPARGGFPSRWSFTEDRLRNLNGTDLIVTAVEAAVDPAEYLGTDFGVEAAVSYLNKYLEFDGFCLVRSGKRYRLRRATEQTIPIEPPLAPEDHLSHEFIAEQIEKCDKKLAAEDYDGAITNARSVVEAVLSDIEARLDPRPPPYDGDLPRLFKRVQRLLNLDPQRPDISGSLKQLLGGLASVIAGLAPLRNKMGDAHVRSYRPARHHAKLAVNVAKTLVDFVYDTFEYQKSRGTIKEI